MQQYLYNGSESRQDKKKEKNIKELSPECAEWSSSA